MRPTTPAPSFPVRSGGGADPGRIAGADPDDLLAPEPENLTGALIGYARVSTSGQLLDRQASAEALARHQASAYGRLARQRNASCRKR